MIDENLLFVLTAFLLGGIVKGIIGTGLPTITLALLTATVGIKQAMAIILLPSILTNIQQGLFGGYLKEILRKSWAFLFASFFTIWLGAAVLRVADLSWLTALLGLILFSYSFLGLKVKKIPQPDRASQKWLNPLVGGINGFITGMTGSSIIPGVLYLQSLAMGKEKLVQTMGLVFLVSTTTLAFAMQKNNLLTKELLTLSFIAFFPSCLGMWLGSRIRAIISEEQFRRLFFIFMLLLGCYIVAHALFFS